MMFIFSFVFHGISTFLGYYSYTNKQFYFKQFNLVLVPCLIVKKILFQANQLNETCLIKKKSFV